MAPEIESSTVVWWFCWIGTILVGVGAAQDYGVSWYVSIGAACWLLGGIFALVARR
jgi:hypothetical protein